MQRWCNSDKKTKHVDRCLIMMTAVYVLNAVYILFAVYVDRCIR